MPVDLTEYLRSTCRYDLPTLMYAASCVGYIPVYCAAYGLLVSRFTGPLSLRLSIDYTKSLATSVMFCGIDVSDVNQCLLDAAFHAAAGGV